METPTLSASTPTPTNNNTSDATSMPSPGPPPNVPPTQPPPEDPKVSKKKPSRTPSTVWDHFTKVVGGDPKESRCTCNYCGKNYACDTRKCGTSTLWNHLSTQCKQYPFRNQDKRQKTLSFQPKGGVEGGGSNLVAVGFSKEKCREAVAKMIIIDELPFRFVENEGFRLFCSVSIPKFDLPSRYTVARDCLKIYVEEKKLLKSLIKKHSQRICLTTDCWTSIQNLNYMVLTAHFIDCNWNLQKRIINFCQVPNHKGETIGKVIEACLHEWGIDKVFTITVDNASSNDVTVAYMKRKLNSWKGSVLEGDFMHMRCCAHIVNLIVNEGLKDMDDSITSIRNAVRYVRSSPSRLQKFKSCVEQEKIEYKGGLALDLPTRWNSTYMMLMAAIQFQKAFEWLEEEDAQYGRYFLEDERRKGPPLGDDWDKARVFLRFLKTFYDVTLKISASLHITSNLYYHELCVVQSELIRWSQSDDPLLGRMATSIKRKYDKYWGSIDNINPLLFISVVLDPRYKMRYMQWCFREVYEEEMVVVMTRKVKDTLVRFYDFYSALSFTSGQFSNVQPLDEVDEVFEKDDVDMRKIRKTKFKKYLIEEDCVQSKSEVDRFLIEACEDLDDEEFDVLGWWRTNSIKYPVLAQIARDALAVPVSTVASESAFSTGGRILDCFRSSLSAKTVEALICTQSWIKSSATSLKLRHYMDDVEDLDQLDSELVRLNINANSADTMSVDD